MDSTSFLRPAGARALVLVLAVAIGSLVAGCDHRSLLVHRPDDRALDEAITLMWAHELQRAAQPGDWVLSRSYSLTGDAIVVLTSGEELSHASLIDPARGTIIESIESGVREISIEAFVRRNRYVMLVRPTGMSEADRVASLARARSAVGAKFDVGGLVGLDDKDAFYCSELVYWAAGIGGRDRDRPRVVLPGALLHHGAVVYFSGRRDDPQLARMAAGWLDERATRGERLAAAAAAGAPAPDTAVASTMDTSTTSNGTVSVDGVAIQGRGGR